MIRYLKDILTLLIMLLLTLLGKKYYIMLCEPSSLGELTFGILLRNRQKSQFTILLAKIFCFPLIFFVPFGPFFTHVSTPTTTRRTTTTNNLLGPLSRVCGPKEQRPKMAQKSMNFIDRTLEFARKLNSVLRMKQAAEKQAYYELDYSLVTSYFILVHFPLS